MSFGLIENDSGSVRVSTKFTFMGSIRSACEGAGGNLVAAGVIEEVKALLGSPG